MRPCPSRFADPLPGVGLDATETLQDRVDRKYVVGIDRLEALVDGLGATHAVLEVEGRRAFAYDTTYFDTAVLRTFRDHRQQRRRRFKCRTREYVDSGLCTFEVKLKGRRARTVKQRMAYELEHRHRLTASALEFLRASLQAGYGWAPRDDLHAALQVSYTRLTLVAPGERVTCDFGIGFRGPGGHGGRLVPDAVVVESKSALGRATADSVLRGLGARPEAVCSKYCLGVALTRPGVCSNWLRPLLGRYFEVSDLSSGPHDAFIAPGQIAHHKATTT